MSQVSSFIELARKVAAQYTPAKTATMMSLALFLLTSVCVDSFHFRTANLPRFSIFDRAVRIRKATEMQSQRALNPYHFCLHSSNSDEKYREDLTYLNEEFLRLSRGQNMISYQDFLGSEAIQAILTDNDSDNYIVDIEDIWKSQAKSLTNSIDLPLFISINRQIDDLFEYVDEDEEENENSEAQDSVQRLSDIIEGRNNYEEDAESEQIGTRFFGFVMYNIMLGRLHPKIEAVLRLYAKKTCLINFKMCLIRRYRDICNYRQILLTCHDGEVIEVQDLDIWDPFFDVKEYFGLDFLKYLKKFYDENTNDENKGLLSYSSFYQWTDIKQMLIDGEIDAVCLKELWDEAILEKKSSEMKNKENSEKEMNKGFKIENDDVKKGFLDFDSFARMNVRLDVVLEELKDALGNLTETEVEDYYRSEFNKMSEGEELISYDQLLGWTDVQELIDSNYITLDQFSAMWDALAKRPLGIFYKKQNIKGPSQSDGISVEAFLVFNTALEDFDSDVSTSALD